MDEYNIFINITHGNEPYILGTSIASELSSNLELDAKIIVPHLFGNRQMSILEENLCSLENVVLDKELGDIQKELVFQGEHFNNYMERVIENIDTVGEQVSEHLKREYGNINLELNIGSIIPSGTKIWKIYYVFPVKNSDLMEWTLKEKDYLGLDARSLRRIKKIALASEPTQKRCFIPFIHSLSFENFEPIAIPTPPLKRTKTWDEPLEKGVYVMLSGTGVGGERAKSFAEKMEDESYGVYVPKWSGIGIGTPLTPDAIFSKDIFAVYARAGFGTIWQCQVAGKPLISQPYKIGDSPEIFFNIKTIETAGLGVVDQGQEGIMAQALDKIPSIESHRLDIMARFGTMDGLDYVVKDIAKKSHKKHFKGS